MKIKHSHRNQLALAASVTIVVSLGLLAVSARSGLALAQANQTSSRLRPKVAVQKVPMHLDLPGIVLTPEQSQRCDAILREEMGKLTSGKKDKKSTKEEAQKRIENFMAALTKRIKPVLTPAQRTKLKDVRIIPG